MMYCGVVVEKCSGSFSFFPNGVIIQTYQKSSKEGGQLWRDSDIPKTLSRNYWTQTKVFQTPQGKLYCRSKGKGAFGGSQYDKTYICDIDRTRRFLKEREHVLNTSSVMES